MTDPRQQYFGTARPEIAAAVTRPFGRLLDVGCGTGATGVLLREGRNFIAGIESDPWAAARARMVYDVVAEVDLDDVEAVRHLELEPVDVLICADVLEHLIDPWSTLHDLVQGYLAPGGQLVVSTPNVQSVEVLAPLLVGRFEYRERGILDRTHLRFFTRRSALAMVRREVPDATVVGSTVPARWPQLFRLLGPFGVRQWLLSGRRRPSDEGRSQ